MARYLVRVLDTAGIVQAVFDDFASLRLELNLNALSNHTFDTIDGDDRLAYFTLDAGVQVLREVDGVWSTIYDGFHRTPSKQVDDAGKRTFTSEGRSLEDLLNRRFIQYYTDTPQTDKTGPTETLMKEYVSENAGPLATVANGRFREVATPMAVQADGGLGITWSGVKAQVGLLSVLQELAQFASIDFAVVRTSAANFEFRTYYPHKGDDRRSTAGVNAHPFSLAHGNMQTPNYTLNRSDEIQTVVVLGQGEGVLRSYIEEVGSGASDSPWNDIEFVDESRAQEDAAGLEAVGIDKLTESGPKTTLAFEAMQTDSSKFGRDYFVGDWITATFDSVVKDLRIIGASIEVSSGKETITLRCEDLTLKPPKSGALDLASGIAQSLRNLQIEIDRLNKKETNKWPKVKGIDFKDSTVIPPLPSDGFARFFPHNGDYYIRRPDGTVHGPVVLARPGQVPVAIEFIIGDGQTVIPTGRHNLIEQLPFDFYITAARLQSVQGDTGSIVIDLETFAPGASPVYTSVCAAAKPTIVASDSYYDATITGWTHQLTLGQGIVANVESAATFKEVGLILEGRRTVLGVTGQPVMVRVASTADVSIAAPGATMDTLTLDPGDRVFLKDQAAPEENGIYVWQDPAIAMTRALDADDAVKFHAGLLIMAQVGGQAGQMWLHTTPGAILLGTTPLTFGHLSMGLSVKEVSGLPTQVDTLEVPNGTLTVLGRTATLTYGSGGGSAASVTYDPTASGLSASDVQAAIDEIAASSGGASNTLAVANISGPDLAVGDTVSFDDAGALAAYRLDSSSPSPWFGVVIGSAIPNGASGTIQTSGVVTGMDTSALAVGSDVWVGDDGRFAHYEFAGGVLSITGPYLHFLGVVLTQNAVTGSIVLLRGGKGVEMVPVHSHTALYASDIYGGEWLAGGALAQVLIAEEAPTNNPPAGYQTLYIDPSDHHLKRRTSTGTVVDLG